MDAQVYSLLSSISEDISMAKWVQDLQRHGNYPVVTLCSKICSGYCILLQSSSITRMLLTTLLKSFTEVKGDREIVRVLRFQYFIINGLLTEQRTMYFLDLVIESEF